MSVTVVVPLYNGAATITRCLDSIAAQVKRPQAVVVVDDASTDGGADIARAHPLPGLSVVSSPINRGPGAARNDGVLRATTGWVAFLDADNEWRPDFLIKVCAAIARLDADYGSSGGVRQFVSPKTGSVRRTIDGAPGSSERSRDLWHIALRFLPVVPSSLVVRRELFERAGGFPVDVLTGEDITLIARLWLIADRFAFVNEALYVSYQQPGSLTAGKRRYHDLRLLLARLGKVLVRSIARRKPGSGWFTIAYARMVLGRHVQWLMQQFRAA